MKKLPRDKGILIAMCGLLVLGLVGMILIMVSERKTTPVLVISSFDECVLAGYPVMNSLPQQCSTPEGRVFVAATQQGSLALQTLTDVTTGISFMYPSQLPATYINAVNWPPSIHVVDKELLNCVRTVSSDPVVRTEPRTIDGNNYCVTISAEGTAGSTYVQYSYATAHVDQALVLQFSLRQQQCLNYDEPEQMHCINEREMFDIDLIVADMFKTMTVR